jgi:hypothetical protein
MIPKLTLEEKIACEKEYRANPYPALTDEEVRKMREEVDEEWKRHHMQLNALRYLNNYLTQCSPESWKYAVDELRSQVAMALEVAEKHQSEADKKFWRGHLKLDFATLKSITYLNQQ